MISLNTPFTPKFGDAIVLQSTPQKRPQRRVDLRSIRILSNIVAPFVKKSPDALLVEVTREPNPSNIKSFPREKFVKVQTRGNSGCFLLISKDQVREFKELLRKSKRPGPVVQFLKSSGICINKPKNLQTLATLLPPILKDLQDSKTPYCIVTNDRGLWLDAHVPGELIREAPPDIKKSGESFILIGQDARNFQSFEEHVLQREFFPTLTTFLRNVENKVILDVQA